MTTEAEPMNRALVQCESQDGVATVTLHNPPLNVVTVGLIAALGEVLTPEDCADAIVYLLGATKVTGQLLRVDGGRSVGRLQGRPA